MSLKPRFGEILAFMLTFSDVRLNTNLFLHNEEITTDHIERHSHLANPEHLSRYLQTHDSQGNF